MTLPSVPDTFRWTQEPWGAALRCQPLERVAPHLFTTRQLQLSSHTHVRLLSKSIGASRIEMVKQVHGREVTVVRRGVDQAAAPSEADALISDDPAVAIAIRAADCVPVLMADRAHGVVAAVHAGWRGTAARVAVAAVDALTREFGTHPKDIVAAIGPSIGPCCYEVGSELVDAFAAAGHERYLIDRWFATPRALSDVEGPPPRGSFQAGRPRLRLDVAGANRDQLILAGLNEADIYVVGLCTAMHLDIFTSYRAEKENAGRLAGVIRSGAGA